MAILEKEVLISLGGRIALYYGDRGYKIPKYIDKQGRTKIIIGEKITVKVQDLPKNSMVRITKVCDVCGKHIYNQIYGQVIRRRECGDGNDRCHKCSLEYSGKTRKNSVVYENSLENYAKKNNKEYLLKEFSSKNIRIPKEVSCGTDDKYIWTCFNCGVDYEMSVFNKSKGYSCPYCAGRRVNLTNCLWATHPYIASNLANKQIGYELTAGSNKKEEFVCGDCGHIEKRIINNIVRRGFQCTNCSDGISYPEKLMTNLLNQLNIKFETQKTFYWSKNKRYDFYISSLNMIIETHGEQHYIESNRGKSLKEEQKNDAIKEILAKDNSIERYIIIDCRKSNLEFIKNNILESELSDLINISDVDWIQANEFACNTTLIKSVCEIWNTSMVSIPQIATRLKISYNTTVKYLIKGNELGWCSFKVGYDKKAVVQLSMDDEFIREFPSVLEASKTLNIQQPSISRVCNGKMKSTGDYKWRFKYDYDQITSTSD
jgi:DNA-directed RNA polymerase subunit RPC12/RpoP